MYIGVLTSMPLVLQQFIREGCLMKLSRKGYQQRMFFLFSDMLVYTSRINAPALQFKVHGQIPLKGMEVSLNPAFLLYPKMFML